MSYTLSLINTPFPSLFPCTIYVKNEGCKWGFRSRGQQTENLVLCWIAAWFQCGAGCSFKYWVFFVRSGSQLNVRSWSGKVRIMGIWQCEVLGSLKIRKLKGVSKLALSEFKKSCDELRFMVLGVACFAFYL
jgi:hypothetical protein